MKYWDNMGGDARDYKDKKIKNMLSAMYAAFDLADPQSEVMQ